MSKKTATEIIADFLSGRHHIGYEDAYEDAEDIPAYLKDVGYYIVDPSKLTLISDEEILALYKEHNWLIFEPDLARARAVGCRALSHTIKQIQEQEK